MPKINEVAPSSVKPKFMCPFPFGALIAVFIRRRLQQQRCDLDKTFKPFFIQHIDLLLYLFKTELIGVGVDRIKVLLELILVCTSGCSSGEQNNTGQKPEDTNVHNSLTVTVKNGTAAITPNLTSYPAGTRMTIEITPDDGDVFYAWSGDHRDTENLLVVTMDGIITIDAACTSAIYQNYCIEADQFLIISDGDSGTYASNWWTGKTIIDENNLRKGSNYIYLH